MRIDFASIFVGVSRVDSAVRADEKEGVCVLRVITLLTLFVKIVEEVMTDPDEESLTDVVMPEDASSVAKDGDSTEAILVNKSINSVLCSLLNTMRDFRLASAFLFQTQKSVEQ